jgi:thioredoxin reductase
MVDVAIIGGSSAGLSAALILGRSLRTVIVIDDQQPCNRFSRASHGFLTRDGTPPAALLQTAREQLGRYPSVAFKAATALRIERAGGGFEIVSSDGSRVAARTVLLATGLRDELPPLDGIEQLWGTSVFHCPYCDGYEVSGRSIAVYGAGDDALHLTTMLRNWTDTLTLCPAEGWTPAPAQRETLARYGIRVADQPIAALEREGAQLTAIRFADGARLAVDALFVRPKTSHRTSFAYDLGCAIDAANVVQVDGRGRTSVEGVYAAGDLASPVRSVAIAVGQGAAAGYGINGDLVARDFP